MHSQNQTDHIKTAREFGALVAGGATYQDDQLRLKSIDNTIQKALGEICAKYKDASGNPVFASEQVDCINHICLQMFCMLDAKSQPPATPIQALAEDIKSKPPLKKWQIVASFLAALASCVAILEFSKSYLPGWPSITWSSSDNAGKTKEDKKSSHP